MYTCTFGYLSKCTRVYLEICLNVHIHIYIHSVCMYTDGLREKILYNIREKLNFKFIGLVLKFLE